MKLIEFPEQTVIIAKDQPEYLPLPAHRFTNDPQGRIACCWKMTWHLVLQILRTVRLRNARRTRNVQTSKGVAYEAQL